MDVRVVKRARELAAPEAIQPRHLLLAALEQGDPSIAGDLRRAGIDADAVARGGSTVAPWDASDELKIKSELERYLQQFGPDAGSRRTKFGEMRRQAIAGGMSPDDPRLAIDPEKQAQEMLRETARRTAVGDKAWERVATTGTEQLLHWVKSRFVGAAIRASDAESGDRVHARGVVAALIPVALAYSGRCDYTRAVQALFGADAEAYLKGKSGQGTGFRGALLHFQETQIERDRRLRPRHVLVAALRTVAELASLPALRSADWNDLRRRLGYEQIVPPDPKEVWGMTHADPAAMEAMSAANESAAERHQPSCDLTLQWAVGAVRALARDERTRALVANSGMPIDEVEALRCRCLASESLGEATVASASDEDVAPPRFRILWQKEAEADHSSTLQARHVIVASLRCLPQFAQDLAAPGALPRLRAGLRAARGDEPPPPEIHPPTLARSVVDALVRSNTLRGFAWWPGMSIPESEGVDAAICLEVTLRDAALRNAVTESGPSDERLRAAIHASSRGIAGVD